MNSSRQQVKSIGKQLMPPRKHCNCPKFRTLTYFTLIGLNIIQGTQILSSGQHLSHLFPNHMLSYDVLFFLWGSRLVTVGWDYLGHWHNSTMAIPKAPDNLHQVSFHQWKKTAAMNRWKKDPEYVNSVHCKHLNAQFSLLITYMTDN